MLWLGHTIFDDAKFHYFETLGAVPLERAGAGSVIQVHSDHCATKQAINVRKARYPVERSFSFKYFRIVKDKYSFLFCQ